MPKMMSPANSIWWVPEEAVTDPDVDLFKASLYTSTEGTPAAAIDISCAVVTGYTLNPTDSDTDDSRSICDEGNVDTPTRENYEASLTFFRNAIDAGGTVGTTHVYDVAFNLFKAGRQAGEIGGYIVERLGYRQSTAVAAGQLLSAYKVIADNPRNEVGDGDAPIQFTVPFFQQGWMRLNKAVADEVTP